ncbi:MAG: hypothetical protein KME12_26715 [Trichocoleus desertorum ATA4-8-CV12]|jgi:hypothetical protein|nr:hypothetical protein [Trichocoleus desertorum ATA4-8-CV12]
MSSTPNPENEAPKPSNETEAVRRLVVPEPAEAAADSEPDRSPGKTDRDIAAVLSSDSAESTEVIRELITPEVIAGSTELEGDRSPGKTDRDVVIPESTTDESEVS